MQLLPLPRTVASGEHKRSGIKSLRLKADLYLVRNSLRQLQNDLPATLVSIRTLINLL